MHRFRTALLLAALTVPACLLLAGDLQAYTNATIVPSRYNDGDSFAVLISNRQVTARLYFVDCPETVASDATTARRVRSQTRYFGVTNHQQTIAYGTLAADFTAERLSRPFTLYTAFATAPGRSTAGRIYSFVHTADGKDLGQLLVAGGLARAYGVRRETPDGTPHDEAAARLADLESAAMLAGRGIWAAANPELLVQERAVERREEAELLAIQQRDADSEPVNVNTASLKELETLPGIGPELATRIVAARPYAAISDLLRVNGIDEVRLRAIEPRARTTPATKP